MYARMALSIPSKTACVDSRTRFSFHIHARPAEKNPPLSAIIIKREIGFVLPNCERLKSQAIASAERGLVKVVERA